MKPKRETDCYPYPPRGMNRIEAARYVGVVVTKFDEMVEDKRMPRPRQIEDLKAWDRLELDAAFSTLPYCVTEKINIETARVRPSEREKPITKEPARQRENFLKIKTLQGRVGLSNSSIYAMMARGRFPQRIFLSPRCVRWSHDEIDDWIEARKAER